ncbi:MAG: glycoside hydrolase family 16 protein [Planctomycetia bacterium]|nr:glycoside hydrolase family 16 protein [Planctomycetia bacterium]
MKIFLPSLICMIGLVAVVQSAPPAGKEWRLTFEETFDGSQVDERKWFPAYRPGRKEYYQRIGHPSRWEDLRAHYVMEDGILKLRLDRDLPRRTNVTNRCVSSIQTAIYRYDEKTNDFYNEVKFAQKYGYFEIRSRMPAGKGLHAAFWLTQVGAHNQEYQVDGKRGNPSKTPVEIDIFELVGSRPKVNEFNVHFTSNGHFNCPFENPEEFHVWGLEWEEGRLTWYLDGKVVRVWEHPTPQHEMFILLGMYQGIFGAADPNMDYPRDFEIDYVRVWQKK